MMRSPSKWALAVRKPDGDIAEVTFPIASPMARHRLFRLPVVRGVVALGESLAIGFRALAISANYAAQEEGEDEEVSTELSRGSLIFAFALAIGFAIMLFKVTPALLTNWLPIDSTGIVDLFVSRQLTHGAHLFAAVENLLNTEVPVGRLPVPTIGLPRAARVGVRVFWP